jgi:hypothetical protein
LPYPSAIADGSKEARVTQIIREVKLLPADAAARDASLNDKVSEDTGVRTGGDSRSELTFPDLTITRLGANTIFSFNKSGRIANVDSGSILLRVPKDSGGGTIRSSAVTVAITGTTVIFEGSRGGRNKLYTLEGSSRVALKTKPSVWRNVLAGQVLDVPPEATTLPMPVNFDVNQLMRTHPLITDFEPLPSAPLIMAVAQQTPPPRGPKPGPTSTPDPSGNPPGTKLCWICIDGKVVQVSEEDARARGRQCYPTKEAAQRECQTCWICVNGEAIQAPEAEARAKGSQCYRTREEALRNCRPKTCWICRDGKAVQVSEAEAARAAKCYPSREEALRDCKPRTSCWICRDGQVVQLTEEQARARVQCYGSREEAAAACKPKSSCWVCIGGRVTQLTEAQAKARRLECYGSREEAQRNCQQETRKCWTCIGGQVLQLTEAQARARGGQCYGSRAEAARACGGQKPSPKPTPRQRPATTPPVIR